ncbi:MAG: hypothetical protein OEL89_00275 [Candidatus Peregrinibacteria bacterium]|nr:hypothetical protein [Candidatus Peregrinibacteria bacterium]
MKKIKLAGHTIKIKFVKSLPSNELGKVNFITNEIFIAKKCYDLIVPDEQKAYSLCHELAHLYMYLLSMHELNDNEPFIDSVGGLMFQTFKTYIMEHLIE